MHVCNSGTIVLSFITVSMVALESEDEALRTAGLSHLLQKFVSEKVTVCFTCTGDLCNYNVNRLVAR